MPCYDSDLANAVPTKLQVYRHNLYNTAAIIKRAWHSCYVIELDNRQLITSSLKILILLQEMHFYYSCALAKPKPVVILGYAIACAKLTLADVSVQANK